MANKRFFTQHKKSSALVVSIAVHLVFVLIALSFVAVTVIQKQEVDFEATPVNRPKMNLNKLQVPVNVKKPPQQPKLRKQIVVKPNVAKITPDLKMPEIVGVKGGLGAGAGGFGNAVSLGFTMPEITMFGVKGKGEKIFIILDSTPDMMGDEMGGIPAYTLIKEEVVKVLGSLPPTALFNIAVYDVHQTVLRFPEMVPASEQNVARVEEWLKPLNAVRPDMGGKDYGIQTLGKGGVKADETFKVGKIQREVFWCRPAEQSMKQQADTVFLLTCFWGEQWHDAGDRDEDWFKSAAARKWQEAYEKGQQLLAEENRQRAEEGQPPRVIRDNPWEINRVYFPDIERPPVPQKYFYTANDFTDAFLEVRKLYRPVEMQAKLGIERKKTSASKVDFSVNVVHFRETGQSINTHRHENTEEMFKQLANRCSGEYRTLAGLEAIRSSVASSSSQE
jgi:hypothetical protein